MSDYGFAVSLPDKDVSKAALNELVVSTTFPMAKLDTTNENSFKTINLFFSKTVPQPTGGTLRTLIYQYPHGFKTGKVPQNWVLAQPFSSYPGYSQPYFFDNGYIAQFSPGDYVKLEVKVDALNVSIYSVVSISTSGQTFDITGTTVKFRIYCFVDDVGY